MKRSGKVYGIVVAWLAVLLFPSCREDKASTGNPLFRQLQPDQTGIHFNNQVTDTRGFNIFKYRNFYNGAGVAIGDINNDGRPDIFFTSNQHENKLFINQGNWKFKGVTRSAGLTSTHQWHTGVTMVDINGDGWLDIYVCNSGDIPGDDRSNELYINQRDGSFREEAHAYGLDDKGKSTQAVFFDYDHDGDLDCFVLNNSNRSVESFGYNPFQRNMRDPVNGDRLYRNDHGKFTDVSAATGIFGSEIGFGQGVTVGDLNNDGWPDIYVSNDFFEKDYLYINQGDGKFKEVIDQAMEHISQSSMGSDMTDINNDGNLDIFTTDMLPEDDYRLKLITKFEDYNVFNAKLKNDFHHQFASNCLQLNNGDGSFSEVACYAGVEATDWSWGALSFDFNNDGWKDIFVCNGIYKDLTNQDFLEFFSSEETKKMVMSNGFDFHPFLDKMKSNPLSNYAFVNQRNLTFKNRSDELGLASPGFSNGAAYGDLDGDGDLDLIVNNENMDAYVYRNMTSETLHQHFLKVNLKGRSPNTFGIGARVTIYARGMQQVLEQMPSRGFESSVDPVLNFGLADYGKVDSLVVRWPDRQLQYLYNVKADTLLTLRQEDANIPFRTITNSRRPLYTNKTPAIIKGDILHKENGFIDFNPEPLIPKMISTEGPKLAVGDVNGDGLDDFFMGGAANDTAKLFLQTPGGLFVQKPQYTFAQDKDYEDIGAEFFDADNDGDLDLLVASGGNQLKEGSLNLLTRLYLNDGKGNFTRSFQGWPMVAINASCIRICDFDGDGKPDIFIGARNIPGNYGLPPSSVLLKNNGNGHFSNVTESEAPGLQKLGMVTDAQWADLDGDGKKELIIVGDWMPVMIFKYNGTKLEKLKEIANSSGWWNCLTVADMNGDGKPDLIAGNNGLNSKIRADRDHPARLFIDDFNHNGQIECVPAYYKSDGRSYPYNLRADLVKQIPALKKKFLHYSDYAGKTVEEVFTPQQLSHAKSLEVRQTQTCIFYNEGRDEFKMTPLPAEAQFSPVFGILVSDMNGDGYKDVFLGGNFYGLKPETGRYDASYGVTFLSDSLHQLRYLKPAESGLFIKGEIRDVKKIHTSSGDDILIARNNEALQIFSKQPY